MSQLGNLKIPVEPLESNLVAILKGGATFEDICAEFPSLDVNIICDLIEKLILRKKVAKIYVFHSLSPWHLDIDSRNTLLLSEQTLYISKLHAMRADNIDELHVEEAYRIIVDYGGIGEESNAPFNNKRLNDLYDIVKEFSDDIFVLFAEIDKLIHYKVFDVLFDNSRENWFLSISQNIRQSCANKYESVREPVLLFDNLYEESEIYGSFSTPGMEELNLFGFTTMTELKEIILDSWNIFSDRVPECYADKSIMHADFNFLLPLRNKIAHPVRVDSDKPGWDGMPIKLDDFSRLENIRGNFSLDQWR